MKKFSVLCLMSLGLLILTACGKKEEEVSRNKSESEFNLRELPPEIRGSLAYQGILDHHQEDGEVLREADLVGETNKQQEVVGRESEVQLNEFKVKSDKLEIIADEFGASDYELTSSDLHERFYKTSVQKFYTDRLANRIQNDDSDSVLERTVACAIMSLLEDGELKASLLEQDIRVHDKTDSVKTIYDIYLGEDDMYTLRMKNDNVKIVDDENELVAELSKKEISKLLENPEAKSVIDKIKIIDEAPEQEQVNFVEQNLEVSPEEF